MRIGISANAQEALSVYASTLYLCMIIGLLLYKTGISANSQEVFSRAHGSLIHPIKRHPCCFVRV